MSDGAAGGPAPHNDPPSPDARHDSEEALLHPDAMRLRPQRTPVTRLSRRVLLAGAAVAAIGVCAALGWALWPRQAAAPKPSISTGPVTPPDTLTSVPKDYAEAAKEAPKLGPPLPGDLGKPLLKAGVTAPGMSTQQTPEQQHITQERDAARTSHLFAVTNSAPSAATTATQQSPSSAPLSAPGQQESDATAVESMQANKLAFANTNPEAQTANPARLQQPASPYIVQTGWVINAALAKRAKSDLPGDLHAQVTENIYDSPTGRFLLIPQGSMLEGKYNSQVSFGQTRMQVIWTRLILPNGKSLSLGHLPGADGQGYAGLEDDVDEHWGSLFKAAVLSTVLSVGAEAGTSDNENNLAQAIRAGASQSINQAGEQIVERNLNVQPTLTERFGLPVTVTVDQDLILEPYAQEAQR